MVNRGERRVRAARKAGLRTVPAFIDERVDPFAQAAENLHREDMSPFDLAAFVREREKEGLTKPRSPGVWPSRARYISEAAALIDAPERVRNAVESGRARLRCANPPPPRRCGTRLSGEGRRTAGGGHADQSGQRRGTARRGGPGAITRRIAGAGHRPVAESDQWRSDRAGGGAWRPTRIPAPEGAGQRRGRGELRRWHADLLPLADLHPVCWATEEQS